MTDTQLQDAVRFMLEGMPQARALGLQLEMMALDRAVLRVPYTTHIVGDPDTGVVHGGVVTTLLDSTCGVAVKTGMGLADSTATLDLRIDYMRSGEPGRDILGEAVCYKRTRTIAFVRATAYHDTPSDPIATAQATFILDSNAGRSAGANLKPRGGS
jgi:uncharacterized protein (TIGR00369 family)